MSDKVNVEEIIGLVKTDEVTNSVEEVVKLRGRGNKMKALNDWKLEDGVWYRLYCTGYDETGDEIHNWKREDITVIPVPTLIRTWEKLVRELGDKETELLKVKEEYTAKEFDIVFKSDINFKELYGSTSEKVRKQHAKEVLSELHDRKVSLELSVEYLRMYIGLLKEVIRSK